ncbi:unnamed protein product [Caenorhabditis angaria]|uniref:F-box domain-containing protein n=1 Tax=Caenorhabditis angaria TaxID=860376 RepID=A0A9P1ICL8_9PELO|nr:unnamed protein product [Caenorhabditis angaria]
MGSCLSRCITERKKTSGTGWFDLPYEIRRIIIDLMDLEGKARLAKCSLNCYEEVALSQNYIEEINIVAGEEGEKRNFGIFVKAKNEKWDFMIHKSASGYCQACWWMNREIYSIRMFKKQNLMDFFLKHFNCILKRNSKSLRSIRIFINDFPYNQTNINNLKSQQLEELTLFENKNGIDPISCGFVNIDTISRFQNDVRIPNCKLDNFVEIKSEFRVLTNPIFTLDEFDDFLRCLLIEEKYESDLSSQMIITIEEFKMHSDFLRIIQKYTGVGIEDAVDKEKIRFWRTSKKWSNREHCLVLKKTYLSYIRNEA